MNNNLTIDFVIIWVDGNDPEWQMEKSRFQPSANNDARTQRYRDWDNLNYWFRGVEKYAPWVSKIHFVTWGHIPKWLNTNHPKLNIVKHTDFIQPQYLPTFNCNPIELNIHRIPGLSEKFVYFNDDTFIIAPVEKADFFMNGLPCDSAALNVHCVDPRGGFNYANFQAVGIINKYFNFHKCLKENWRKWFSLKNGKYLLRTLYLLPCPRFPGIYQPHLPNSFLKSTFETIWEKEYELMNETCLHKFRDKLDYTQWTMRCWQLANGTFINRNTTKYGKSYYLEKGRDSIESVCKYINKQSGKTICINDGDLGDTDFKMYKDEIKSAFSSILPDKCSFEK